MCFLLDLCQKLWLPVRTLVRRFGVTAVVETFWVQEWVLLKEEE
jgi:hypothetical protein